MDPLSALITVVLCVTILAMPWTIVASIKATRKLNGPKHEHRFRSVGVTNISLYEPGGAVVGSNPSRRYAEVLEVCTCGEKRTIQLEGKWKLEQVQAMDKDFVNAYVELPG